MNAVSGRVIPAKAKLGQGMPTQTQGTQVITAGGEVLPVTKLVLIAEPNDVWRAEVTMLVSIEGDIQALLSDSRKCNESEV